MAKTIDLEENIEKEINKINKLYDTSLLNLEKSFKEKHDQLLMQEKNMKEKLNNEVTKVKEELENNLIEINNLIKLS